MHVRILGEFVSYQISQYVVRNVARGITERLRSAVRKDDRRFCHRESVPHRLHGDVRKVHEHAEPIQLPNDRLAKRRKTVAVKIRRRVRVRIVDGARISPVSQNRSSNMLQNSLKL